MFELGTIGLALSIKDKSLGIGDSGLICHKNLLDLSLIGLKGIVLVSNVDNIYQKYTN